MTCWAPHSSGRQQPGHRQREPRRAESRQGRAAVPQGGPRLHQAHVACPGAQDLPGVTQPWPMATSPAVARASLQLRTPWDGPKAAPSPGCPCRPPGAPFLLEPSTPGPTRRSHSCLYSLAPQPMSPSSRRPAGLRVPWELSDDERPCPLRPASCLLGACAARGGPCSPRGRSVSGRPGLCRSSVWSGALGCSMVPDGHLDGGHIQGSLVNGRAAGCHLLRLPISLHLAFSPAPWGPVSLGARP